MPVGYKHTKEAKRKMREAAKNKKLSEEHKRKIGEASRGRKLSEEHKRRIGKKSKGRRHTEEARHKMSESGKKKKLSPEHKRKISEALSRRVIKDETREKLRQRALERGAAPPVPDEERRRRMSETQTGKRRVITEKWKRSAKERGKRMRGQTMPEEQKQKISETLKGREFSKEHRKKLAEAGRRRMMGENCPWYIDGRSKIAAPYPEEFNNYLKRKIRLRDNQTCQICQETAKRKRGHIHHIDGDKQNCKMGNLVLVCISCHNKIHNTNSIDDPVILEWRAKLTWTVGDIQDSDKPRRHKR